jgi:hypothetical protein
MKRQGVHAFFPLHYEREIAKIVKAGFESAMWGSVK